MMLCADAAVMRQGLGESWASHRRPLLGRYLGMVVGHVAPEAYAGGTIALVKEGDSVTSMPRSASSAQRAGEGDRRARKKWKHPSALHGGLMAKIQELVSTASLGGRSPTQNLTGFLRYSISSGVLGRRDRVRWGSGRSAR